MFRQNINSHRFPFVPVVQVGIGESTFDESPENDPASGSKSTCCENETRDLPCRPLVAKENDAFPSNESIEQDYDRMSLRAIRMQMGMQGPRHELWRIKRLDKSDKRVLVRKTFN